MSTSRSAFVRMPLNSTRMAAEQHAYELSPGPAAPKDIDDLDGFRDLEQGSEGMGERALYLRNEVVNELAWSGLTVTVKDRGSRSKEMKNILEGVDGVALAGKISNCELGVLDLGSRFYGRC